ncbi:MAG TPA: response regulator transcription factor [Gaiellaceae bacterium]|nr:response regulator transcription factor [Gaiellaceae bacterium]
MERSCGTIAIVDHEARARALAAQAAARLGYEPRPFPSAEELLADLAEPPALAVVEVELPGGASGLELLGLLQERYGDGLPVILVSARRTSALDRVAGLLLGADDYLAKPVDAGELLARMRRSLRRSANGRPGSEAARPPVPDLSPREREILRLLAEGKTQAQIAAALVISPKTVATHIQRVLGKLGVHSRAQAVAVAYRLGLVGPEVEGHLLAGDLAPVE